jgi:hypothetical protein
MNTTEKLAPAGEVKNLLLKFEAIDDSWCRSGIVKSKEVLAVVKLFIEL